MTDWPIIFSAPMIRALLDGRKAQTRRLAWKYGVTPPIKDSMCATSWQRVKPGDRLWVRESFAHAAESPRETLVVYRSTTEPDGGFDYIHKDGCIERLRVRRWHPSIHMPRSYSRLTLTVTATKIERLQKISEADAKAEGVSHLALTDEARARFDRMKPWPELHRPMFMLLWETLHGAGSWAWNPEVVALTFTVAKRNIDAA